MPYYISIPTTRERVKLFRPKQPNDKIFPGIVLGMDGIHWVKYILSCVAHKGVRLNDHNSLINMILDPNWGVYNRCLYWAFKIADLKEESHSGFYVARTWNYGKKARASGRDYFDYVAFGKLLSDIVNTEKSKELIQDWSKLEQGKQDLNELSEFLQRFKNDVLGINLAAFPINKFFREVKPTEKNLQDKRQYAKLFINRFIKLFSKINGVEEMMRNHSINNSYVNFVKEEMNIKKKEDIERLVSIKIVDALAPPEELEPSLSDRGYDAFLLIDLLKNSVLFCSFILQTYMDKQGISFMTDFINLREEIDTKNVMRQVEQVGSLLKRYKSSFEPSAQNENFQRTATWWEFNQFEYMMERLTWEAYQLTLNDLNVNEMVGQSHNLTMIEIVEQFLKSFNAHHHPYIKFISEDVFVQHLQEIDKIEPNQFGILKAITEKIPCEEKEQGSPMLVGLEAFQRWSRSVLFSLGGLDEDVGSK